LAFTKNQPARSSINYTVRIRTAGTSDDSPQKPIRRILYPGSRNKHTPEIIRGYAQSGVRFISGKEPPERWLAKNYAYEQLAGEANGELLLFCGVDVRFTPSSLELLVKTMLQKRKTMVSAIPRNVYSSTIKELLVQPGRYAWELSLPRRMLNRPPVLSSCWLIASKTLKEAGGFAAVTQKVVPESYFSRFAASNLDGYSFMQAGKEIDITSVKSFEEQYSTAIRTRYPQTHRRVEIVAATSLAEFVFLILPIILFALNLLMGMWLLAALAGVAYALQAAAYSKIVNLTYRRRLWKSILVFPLAAAYDIFLLNDSMLKYEFGEVLWKSRNICLPVLQFTAGSAQKQ
jgi:hypothetical protein